jgi:hypothetical protein
MGKIDPLLQAYPTNLIVDTKTMVIAKEVQGYPDASFYTAFEAVMASP